MSTTASASHHKEDNKQPGEGAGSSAGSGATTDETTASPKEVMADLQERLNKLEKLTTDMSKMLEEKKTAIEPNKYSDCIPWH